MPNETITVHIRQTAAFGDTPLITPHHMYVIYTNSSGQQYYLGGWSNGNGASVTGLGQLDTQVRTWDSNALDYQYRNLDVATQVVKSGADLSSYWTSMTQCANQIDYANLGYTMFVTNSNSVVNTCLAWANLPTVSINSSSPLGTFWTPGGGTDLRNLFNLYHKYNGDESAPPSASLKYYEHHFGFAGTGERFLGGTTNPTNQTLSFGGSSGHWVYSSVQVEGGAASSSWRWVEASATQIKPVVLDLDGDGLEVTAASASPGFDFFASGHVNTTGWFKGGDGLLVYDGNQNGFVDNGSEISFLHNSPGAMTDLQGLRAFDTNLNNKLDSGDAMFSRFRIWKDSDMDGISDAGELKTLANSGVVSVNLTGSGGGYKSNGNEVYAVASFARSGGGTGSAYDVGFEAYSRGTKLLYSNSTWALVELDALDKIAVAQPNAPAANITDLRNFLVNGGRVHGLQLGSLDDYVSTTRVQADDRSYYVDGGAGNDTIDLSASLFGSTIKGGAGSDIITGGTGNDFIAPGTTVYGDTISDTGGNDTYLIDPNSFMWIYDMGGTEDVALLTGYRSTELNFSYWDYWQSVFISTTDGLVGIHFEYMYTSSNHGIEYLWLEDGVMTRDMMIERATAGTMGMSGMEAGIGAQPEDLGMIHIV